jgi:sec-independent protein translocase protein TatA
MLAIGIAHAAINIVIQILIWLLRPRNIYSALNYALGGGWGIWSLLSTLSIIISIGVTALVIYLIVMAYNYKQVELPVIGPIAAKASEKLADLNLGQQVNNNQASANQQNNADADSTPESADKPVFCGECGAKNDAGTKFCGGCGKPLS